LSFRHRNAKPARTDRPRPDRLAGIRERQSVEFILGARALFSRRYPLSFRTPLAARYTLHSVRRAVHTAPKRSHSSPTGDP
jgi:hypothetical protein